MRRFRFIDADFETAFTASTGPVLVVKVRVSPRALIMSPSRQVSWNVLDRADRVGLQWVRRQVASWSTAAATLAC